MNLTKEYFDKALKNFASKSDLKGLATKKDLEQFATKNDLKKFATKRRHQESRYQRCNERPF